MGARTGITGTNAALTLGAPAIGECVGYRFRGFPDIDGNDPWRYIVGRDAEAEDPELLQRRFPMVEIERVYVPAKLPPITVPSDTTVAKLTGGADAEACFHVVLHGERYTRHGNSYVRWYEVRNPRSGMTENRSRVVESPRAIALIDAAIAAHSFSGDPL